MASLYRKYRPQSFDQVVGQDHITTVLTRQIERDEVGHAYIFSGGRGTGKTSTARIFAAALGTQPVDVFEYDAATYTGVDSIRDLKRELENAPFQSAYRVYILDEAHMFSHSSWAALLKVVEEAPKHVIFIFCTTEKEKIPETIISRAQGFEFAQPTREVIQGVIADIAVKEGYKLAPEAAALIALLARGSFRDAETVLQKVITASKDTTLSEEEVASILNVPPPILGVRYLTAIAEADSGKALGVLRDVVKAGDADAFLTVLIDMVRDVMMARLEKREPLYADLAPLIGVNGKAITSSLLERLFEARRMGAWSPLPELPLELLTVELFGESV